MRQPLSDRTKRRKASTGSAGADESINHEENHMTTTHRATLRTARTYIETRQEFDANGTLTGRIHSGESHYRGPIGELRSGGWLERFHREAPTYVVYSYSTPIAWWSAEHGWTRPDRRYSVTTSKHQGCCPLNESKD